jgi:glycolate oxidase
MADFILFADSLKEKVGMRIVSFGHAGDGNLHIYLCRDQLSEESYKSKLLEAFKLLYEEATRVGGLVSGEHGIG